MSNLKNIYKTVIIGGSNTVIAGGYIKSAVEHLKFNYGIGLDIVENLSVGASHSSLGLSQILASRHLDKSDILIIEYALNDENWANGQAELLDLWCRINEGIIRTSININPNLCIIQIILSRKNGKHRLSPPVIHALTKMYSEHYKTICINVHNALYELYGHDYTNQFGLYKDADHYGQGKPVELVGTIVADQIAFQLPQWQKMHDLPRKIHSKCFTQVEYITPSTHADRKFISKKSLWVNSRFTFEASHLECEDELVISILGEIISFDFISFPDVSPLQVSTKYASFVIPTRRSALGEKFKFLHTHFVPTYHGIKFFPDDHKGELEVTFRPLRPNDEKKGTVIASNSVFRHGRGHSGVPLIGIQIGNYSK